MATRTRKATTDTVETIVEDEVKDPVKQEVVKEEKKQFSRGDYIMCHSVTSGGLNVSCRSGNYYEFKNYGAECEIEYQDLVSLVRKGSDHIFKPRFIIDDEDFVKEFPQIARVYKETYTSKNLMEIINLPIYQMEIEISKLPEVSRNEMKSLIATAIGNGSLDSVKKIRRLSEIFNSDFNLLSQLFSR